MSIRSKLLLAIISTLVIIGSITAFVFYQQNNQMLSGHVNTDTKKIINYTFQLVNFYLGRVENDLTNLAKDPIIIEALQTKDPQKLIQASEKLTIVNRTIDSLENIGLHEVVGSKCVAITADDLGLSTVGRDWSDRDYCQGIIKTKTPYLSSAFISAVSKRPSLGLAIPVQNNKKEMIGYVMGVIDLNELRGYLWDLQEDSAVDLLDRYGTLFFTTKEKIETLDNAPNLAESEVVKIQNRLAENKKEGYFQDGEDFIGYKFNDSITVIFKQPITNLLAFTRTLNLTLVIALLLVIFLTMIVIVFFVGKITKRISLLSKVSERIASGKFDINLDKKDLAATDETGVLARTFNEMTIKLNDFYKHLEEKVKQRTQEVEEKNRKLEAAEIELKKALELSEHTNKIMVGRELQMKNLKQEIIELKKKSEKDNSN